MTALTSNQQLSRAIGDIEFVRCNLHHESREFRILSGVIATLRALPDETPAERELTIFDRFPAFTLLQRKDDGTVVALLPDGTTVVVTQKAPAKCGNCGEILDSNGMCQAMRDGAAVKTGAES